MPARLLIEPTPQSGARNMAVDETLLESAIERGICTLRWYRWSEATLSLGYFQKRGDPAIAGTLRELPLVRRLTGGGAIVHHHEWTYSCAITAAHPRACVPGELYAAMHQAIIGVLASHGIEAHLRGQAAQGSDATPSPPGRGTASKPQALKQGDGPQAPFLCFSRGDANDVMLAGHKIAGSAQRRRRGAILQHGSLLWRASEHAPHLPGVCDLGEEPIDESQLVCELAAAMGAILGDDVGHGSLSNDELDRAGHLEAEGYCDVQR